MYKRQDYNQAVLEKIFNEAGLSFTPLFDCGIYAYMSKKNPLSDRKEITMEDLDDYPCLTFAQGDYNSFYFAEEVLSTYHYKRIDVYKRQPQRIAYEMVV